MSFAKWKVTFAAIALAGALVSQTDGAAASTAPPSIPFADHGGIFDWRANGDNGIWVQSVQRQWYYGTFVGTCLGLGSAPRIGFATDATGGFDRWSAIIVPHEPRCRLSSFEPSAGPPTRRGALS